MPHMSEHSVWLFDFDGTLADSEALILASFRYAAQRVLGAVPDDDVLRAGIGLTLEQQTRNLAGDRADELFEVYVAHNQTTHAELLAGFDGVPEMLRRLTRLRCCSRCARSAPSQTRRCTWAIRRLTCAPRTAPA